MTILVGIVGGIASGKSTVSKMFVDLGATIVDADKIAREVLNEKHIIRALCESYGHEILGQDGYINREWLATRVFKNPADTHQLNQIIHPSVGKKMNTIITKAEGVVIIDAPLLLESSLSSKCDHLIFVHASEMDRLERAATRGWAADELPKREAVQMGLGEKCLKSTQTINNSGSLEQTQMQVKAIYENLLHPNKS